MPFLRFTRDKRGYETTSLVHAVRRGGRSRQKILYWFRTPPGVKVGRPALDEDAIRWIEEHNPDIEFNWPKILEAQPPAEAPAEEPRGRRSRRDKPERRKPAQAPPQRPDTSQRAAPKRADLEADLEPEIESEAELEPEPEPELEPEGQLEAERGSEEEEVGLSPSPDSDVARAFEQITHPEAEETPEPAAVPVQEAVSAEQLTRLRARYAELQARITERGGDPERIEALRAQAEPLNPDTWVTEEEVRKGLEMFESGIRDLRAALGLRRRRRSRRGGRRRHGGGGAGTPPAETPPKPSE